MATTQLLKPRYSGSIEYGDDMMFASIDRGVVIINGASPNAKVSVYSFEAGRKAGVQVDAFVKATIDVGERELRISGVSARASREFHEDLTIEIKVALNNKCADCGGS